MADDTDHADADANEAGSAVEPGRDQASMPILYRRPVPLIEGNFTGHGYETAKDWSFARGADLVPLTDDQFAETAGCYPILFATHADATVCVLGVRGRQNLFVDDEGDWRRGYPIPNYIRRYPFIMESLGDNNFRLCVDADAPMITTKGGDPLFVDGQPSDVLIQAKEKCTAYQARSAATRQFCQTMREAGLLVQKDFIFRTAEGGRVGVANLSIVDKAKLDEMADDTLAQWYRNGYLSLIYCHLVSLRSWPRLVARSEGSGGEDRP